MVFQSRYHHYDIETQKFYFCKIFCHLGRRLLFSDSHILFSFEMKARFCLRMFLSILPTRLTKFIQCGWQSIKNSDLLTFFLATSYTFEKEAFNSILFYSEWHQGYDLSLNNSKFYAVNWCKIGPIYDGQILVLFCSCQQRSMPFNWKFFFTVNGKLTDQLCKPIKIRHLKGTFSWDFLFKPVWQSKHIWAPDLPTKIFIILA